MKALYGLKQAGHEWYSLIRKTLLGMALQQATYDPCVFHGHMQDDGGELILVLHVDDGLIATNSENLFKMVISVLTRNLQIKVMKNVEIFLGLEIRSDESKIKLTQSEYTKKVLNQFGFLDSNPSATPYPNSSSKDQEKPTTLRSHDFRSVVGNLWWLALGTRPDISLAVAELAQDSAAPTIQSWRLAGRILRYLAGSIDKGICFFKDSKQTRPTTFADSDWRVKFSQSGYVVFMQNGPIIFCSRKQRIVALSTAEAELVAATEAAKDLSWLKGLMEDLKHYDREAGPLVMYEDNSAAIVLSETSLAQKRTKHMERRYFYINEAVTKGLIVLRKVKSADNVADLLTKPLSRVLFQKHAARLVQ